MKQVKNFHIFIDGRVQGVGFRHYTHKKALQVGLKGWVRNLLDGRVEVKVSGPESDLSQFFEDIRKGPAFSKVKDVKIEDLEEEMTQEFFVKEDETLKVKSK